MSQEIEKLRKENEDLTEKVKEANGEAEELFYANNELNFNYEELKKKAYNSIKNLVENNIEKKEEEIEELKKGSKKYSEEDLKDLLHKASEKSKKKIEDLTKKVSIFERDFEDLSNKYSNLELTNKNLENKLQEINAEKEIDQILDGKITDSEIDQVLKQTKIIRPAEEQLEQMLDKAVDFDNI